MPEEQRAPWTVSSPILAEYNTAVQECTKLSYTTSELYKDLTEAKMKRDLADFEKISSKLARYSPFSPDPSVRNTVNGVVAQEGVNKHEPEPVGCKTMHKMIRLPTFLLFFSRKDKARTLGGTSAVSALLFQRFLIVSKTGELSLQEVLSYKLSPFPLAFFEARNIFLKVD